MRPLLLLVLCLTAACAGGRAARTPSGELAGRDLPRNTPARLQDLIDGRIPGLSFTEGAGGRVVMRLRGVSSFTGGDQPLVVLDDLPVTPEPDGTLPGVTVSDIARIRVLKTPAETAPYGLRGAHGVILVQTRRGAGG